MPLHKSKLTKWVFSSDLHGDMQDADSVKAFLQFVKKFKPDVKIFGGDLFDFRAIRRGATNEEKADSMALDIQLGLKFLGQYKPHVFLRGNHDERLWDQAKCSFNGLSRDHAQEGARSIETKCKIIKCKMLPYDVNDGVYRLGKLTFVHGYHAGINATKKHAEVFAESGGAVLHGHTHAIQSASVVRHPECRGYAVGCLAQTKMGYNRHMTGRFLHQNGWAYGVVWKDGYEVMQARRMGDKWLYGTNIELHD